MSDILCKLIALGNEIGTVTSAMMYDGNYMTVSGKKADGAFFDITFTAKEVLNNDES